MTSPAMSTLKVAALNWGTLAVMLTAVTLLGGVESPLGFAAWILGTAVLLAVIVTTRRLEQEDETR